MLKRVISNVLILATLFSLMVPSVSNATSMDLWTADWRQQVFQDTTKPASSSNTIDLVVAKNEVESAQILLRSNTSFTINNVSFSSLIYGSNIIGASNLTYKFVEYFHAVNNTQDLENPIRTAPADLPDALSNATSKTVSANTTQPIWIKVYTPSGTETGTYLGTITVSTSVGDFYIPINLEVNNVTIPDSSTSQFSFEFWNQLVKCTVIPSKIMLFDAFKVWNGQNSLMINNNDSTIQYSGSWGTDGGRTYGDYQNDVAYCTSFNAEISYTFTGTGIEFITETNNDEGLVDVFIDNVFQQTVNCESTSRLAQQSVFSKKDLSNGTHTIKLVKSKKGIDVIKNAYGFDAYSTQWWELMDKFAQMMKENRWNSLTVNTTDLLIDGGTTIDQNGNYIFNWSKFDQFIQVFIDKGAVKKLAGYHLLANVSGESDYWIEGIVKDTAGNPMKTYIPFNSGGEAYLEKFLPALQAHLQAKGWDNLWYQHTGDEANNSEKVATYKAVRNLVNQYCPGMKVGDAVYIESFDEFVGYVDIWTPLLSQYEEYRNKYDSRIEAGDTVWTYLANTPRGTWINRFIDSDLYKMELVGWLCYKRGLTGFLHWGLNQWGVFGTIGDQINNEIYLGDCWTVYPDATNNDIKSSIRVDATREASESYELFKILETNSPELAKNIADSMVSLGMSYNTDINAIKNKRAELVRAAAGLTPGMSIANNNDLNIVYTGTWGIDSRNWGDYFHDVAYSTSTNGSFEYTFTGTGVDYVTEKNSDQGGVDIYIDGVFKQNVSCYNSSRLVGQTVYSISQLPYGKHVIKGVRTSGILLVDAFKVRSRDTSLPAMVIVNNNDSGIQYAGGWGTDTRNFGDYNNDVGYSYSSTSPQFEYTFTGTGIDYISELNSDQGEVDIYIDDVYQQTIDCYNDSRVVQQTVFSRTDLSYGTHKIKGVKKSSNASECIIVDAFKVWTQSTTGIVNNTDSGIQYNGTWASESRSFGDYLKDVAYSYDTASPQFIFTFTGTGIEYITEKNSDEGEVDIYIDDVFQQTINCYNASRMVQQSVYSKTGLNYGTHTIKGVKKSNSPTTTIIVDGFRVLTGIE